MLEERAAACNVAHLDASDCSRLQQLGFTSMGVNAVQNTADSAWVGNDGTYQGLFNNTSPEQLVLVVWNQAFGYSSSFVQSSQPRLTLSLPPGATTTISFADTFSGAWAAIYKDTQMANGQISNTWGEATTGTWGTVDVSREVNMAGHDMSIVTPGVQSQWGNTPSCTSDMNNCVFVCNSGNTCGTEGSYTLQSCANKGMFGGADSGGCQGWSNGGTIKVTLGN
jgi:hypothetical protein